jgi:hypothetical protein
MFMDALVAYGSGNEEQKRLRTTETKKASHEDGDNRKREVFLSIKFKDKFIDRLIPS